MINSAVRRNPFPRGEGGFNPAHTWAGLKTEEERRNLTVLEQLVEKNMEKNEKLTKRAQNLRKNQTKEESLLWYQFLCRYPVRFRRQYVIGKYIVDFYCHKAKLVVELDGSQHYSPEEMAYDKARTRWLESKGLRVMRFTNLEVMRRFRSVCEAIDMTVKQILGTDELG